MNYPKPQILSEAIPQAIKAPAYCFVPQYRCTYELVMPKKPYTFADWLAGKEEEVEVEESGGFFGSMPPWKKILLFGGVLFVIIFVMPTVVRMMKRR